MYGSVRGVPGDRHSYRDKSSDGDCLESTFLRAYSQAWAADFEQGRPFYAGSEFGEMARANRCYMPAHVWHILGRTPLLVAAQVEV